MFSKDEIKKLIVVGLIITFAVLVFQIFDNFTAVLSSIQYGLNIVMPIIVGFAIAYVLNIPMSALERLLFEKIFKKNKLKLKLKRAISLSLTMVLFVLFVSALFSFMIPQFFDSIKTFGANIEGYVENVSKFLNEKLIEWNISDDIIAEMVDVWNEFLNSLKSILGSIAVAVRDFFLGLLDSVLSTFISSVLAIYMLLSKEGLLKTLKKGMHAFLPSRLTKGTIKYMKLANEAFSNFIRGQMLEAVILGILCFIGMTLFRFEYAILISVIVGLTNIIPLFGPYIGAIPSFLILLVVNPVQALWFILYVSVLQQIESNIIYPRVVGNSMGMSGFWILIAVIVGNSLFGIIGIILGIPLFSTLYDVVGEFAENRLKKKNLKFDEGTGDV